MKPKLKLTPAAVRRLEKTHGIKNLLVMGEEDTGKLSLDFFIDFTVEGSAHLGDKAPTREQLEEDGDLRELIDNVKTYLGNG